MQVITDRNNQIVAFAEIGSLTGGVEIDPSILPSNFVVEFKPGKYRLENNTIIYNKDYSEVSNPDTEPTNTMQEEIDSLRQQVEDLTTIVNNMNN